MILIPMNKRIIPTAKHFLNSGYLSMPFPHVFNYIGRFCYKNTPLEFEPLTRV
jgi:hypothetical protein